MRVRPLAKYFLVGLLLLLPLITISADVSTNAAAQLLPNTIGAYRATGPARPVKATPPNKPEDFGGLAAAQRSYNSAAGESYTVALAQTNSEAGAYAMLTSLLNVGASPAARYTKLDNVGTAALASADSIAFFRGPYFVHLGGGKEQERLALAQSLAATLNAGSGEIPALVAHLPDGAALQGQFIYAVSLAGLQAAIRNQPVLDAVSFAGGTEAAAAKYDQGQLVIVEFQTPQLATDTDARVVQRIAELRTQTKPVPSAYRREGNYSVFVFDAPSEQAANELIGQVKYEKVVQWLGEDPHRFERANRFWINMSSSLIVNTVKATGLAILLCLGVGGLFGGVIFMRRRAQAALSEKYSDAGGMMRLNLDELAAEQTPAARLLPPREE
jgi:hypothetical protein